jgi:hypothetical protein
MEERKPGWNAARGFLLPEREETAAMRWGTAFEDAVAKLARQALGGRVTQREKEWQTQFEGRVPLTCHIDGIIGGKLYEGKTASSFSFNAAWGERGVPNYYQAQVQHNLFLTGLREAVVACLEFPVTPEKWEANGWKTTKFTDGNYCLYRLDENGHVGKEISPSSWAKALAEMGYFHVYEIEADMEAREAMLAGYRKFWESVKAEEPPEPESYEDVKRLFPEPRGTLIAPPAIEMKLREHRDIGEEIGASGRAAKRREQLKTEALAWARTQATTLDDESMESLIIRNEAGEKIGSFGKTKAGTLAFRT